MQQTVTIITTRKVSLLYCFCHSNAGISLVLPNESTHPKFKLAFDVGISAGVVVHYLQCQIEDDSLNITD